jgi:hypothetical protein
VMIESVMRDRVLYVNMYQVTEGNGEPGIIQYRLRAPNGEPLPEWISLDPRGSAIIEIPVGMDALHLIVDAVRADGSTVSIPVIIHGGTGEIQLDREGGTMRIGALPLSQDMGALASATDIEVMQLMARFGGQ